MRYVILFGAQQPPNHRQGRREIGERIPHSRLMDRGAPTGYSVHRQHPFFPPSSIPHQRGLDTGGLAGGDHIHPVAP